MIVRGDKLFGLHILWGDGPSIEFKNICLLAFLLFMTPPWTKQPWDVNIDRSPQWSHTAEQNLLQYRLVYLDVYKNKILKIRGTSSAMNYISNLLN